MDRRSWLWRKKSSEKSPGGETESSGSISSHSERYSDDQDQSKASPVHNTQYPEVTSKSPEVMSKSADSGEQVTENMKNLTEKLSAALLNISAKEDLVKQHSKVAEEAVSGWEKAENEVVVVKQQLEAATQKNLSLEDRLGHLDGALKECVRQLRQAREEQEQKIEEAVARKTHELEYIKLEMEAQLAELHTKLEFAKAEAEFSNIDPNLDLKPKLEDAKEEISNLRRELLARDNELEINTLERDLSVQAAETASKQHLDSIKKVSKLEAECRRLRAAARKANSNNDQRSFPLASSSSIYVESFTDSQSDYGDRLLALDSDPPRKMENLVTSSSMDISLMDDFLEMEKLAALPEAESMKNKEGDHLDQTKADLEAMIQRISELEEKIERIEVEKADLEMALSDSQDHLEISQDQLRKSEEKLIQLQTQLNISTESEQATKIEMESVNSRRKELESQVVAMDAEIRTLRSKIDSLETDIEDERALTTEIMTKYRSLEDQLTKTKHENERKRSTKSNGELKIKQEKELAVAAGKLAECQKTIASLGQQLQSLATLEDFMIDSTSKPLELVGSPTPNKSGGEYWNLHSNDAYLPKTVVEEGSRPSTNTNDNNGESLSSSSSSSTSSVNRSVNSEKSRNGFSKMFSRGKSGISDRK